jgi:hypothetical protein
MCLQRPPHGRAGREEAGAVKTKRHAEPNASAETQGRKEMLARALSEAGKNTSRTSIRHDNACLSFATKTM